MKILLVDDKPAIAGRTVDTHIKPLRTKLRAITPHRAPIIPHRGLGYSVAAS